MSANSVIGDFDLNNVKLRKPLEFPDGTIQDTAYTGDGSETLAEVLAIGNDALGQDIDNLGNLEMNGSITQNNLIAFNGNVLDPVLIATNTNATNAGSLYITNTSTNQELIVIPRCINDVFNPIVEQDDTAIIGNAQGQNFTICPDSATNVGIRMTDTTMTLGAGGAGNTPSNSIAINTTANRITATTADGMVVQSSTIQPDPTLRVADVPSGQALFLIPIGSAGSYNPISQVNNQQLIAWGSAGINTQTLEISPHSSVACGIKIAPTQILIGAGGTGAVPTNYTLYLDTGTQHYGASNQFVNGVATYDTGSGFRNIPSAPSLTSATAPGFEILTYHLTGDAGTSSATMTLAYNVLGTTNYSVFPSIYYGYGGSGGTYNAQATASALSQIVIDNITATQFSWVLNKTTGNNVNIYLQFLVVYQMRGTDYPKAY